MNLKVDLPLWISTLSISGSINPALANYKFEENVVEFEKRKDL